MKTIKIDIPEGFEVENFDPKTGELKFRQKLLPRIDRITNFDQVCTEMGVAPSEYEVTETKPQLRGLQIMKRLMLICECFQAGELLDIYNTDQRKWYPWFNVSSSGFRFFASDCAYTFTGAVLGPLLSFPSETISDYVGKTFIHEYQSFAELNNQSA